MSTTDQQQFEPSNSAPDDLKISEILDFWFGEIEDEMPVESRNKLWFGGGQALDSKIKEMFEPLLLQADAGDMQHWQSSARGTLALIILLDQFPLNIYRRTARAFSFESKAINICKSGLAKAQDKELYISERSFFYLPLEHSENLDDQKLSIKLFQAMYNDAPEKHKSFTAETLKYALEHHETIVRFGRYPYRNEVLGRCNTPSEEKYLAGNANRYGQ